jgi:hypothetical protein
MSRFFWNPDRDRELARRYIIGETPEDIAATLGCTVQALRTRCSTLGIVRRKLKGDAPVHGNAHFLLRDPSSGSIEGADVDGAPPPAPDRTPPDNR